MALSVQIKECQERLGKATQDAKKAAPATGTAPTAEQTTTFNNMVKAAHAIGVELQGLRSQQDLENLQGLADGPVEPEVHELVNRNPATNGSAPTSVHLQPEQLHSNFVARRDARALSNKEYMARFGVSREAHAAGFTAFLRSKGTIREGKADAIAAMRAVMGASGPSEAHLHALADDGLGGFTSGDDFRAEVIRALPGFSVMRASGARVINTSKATVQYPVLNRAAANPKQYTSDLTQGITNWRAEGATSGGTARTPQNKPTFGMEEIPVHIWQPDPVELTQQLLEDTDIDLEGLLRDLFAETKGFDEDLAFLRGDGVNNPEGLLNSGATQVVVGDASEYSVPVTGSNGFSYIRLVAIFTDLAAQYRQRAKWYMNSDTLGRLITLGTGGSAGDQHPVFPANAVPGTLFNRPIYFTEFLDNGATAGNFPILFGDPSYYVIVERRQLGIVRLVERYAPNIGLQPTARVGAQLVLKEAFRLGSVQA